MESNYRITRQRSIVASLGTGKRRSTPIPVQPPRIPTPMPVPTNNNNLQQRIVTGGNAPKTTKDHRLETMPTKVCPKFLDNDIQKTWINPRLISKIDLNAVTSHDYTTPLLQQKSNMNGLNQATNQTSSSSSHQNFNNQQYQYSNNGGVNTAVIQRHTTTAHHHPIMNGAYQQQQQRQSIRNNGATPPTQCATTTREQSAAVVTETVSRHVISSGNHYHRQQPVLNMKSSANNNELKRPMKKNVPKLKVGAQSNRNSLVLSARRVSDVPGTSTSVNAQVLSGTGGVFGMYDTPSNPKFGFSVNNLVTGHHNTAQASAAAAFFARASQKLNLSSSPHRRKRHSSGDEDTPGTGFCGVIQRSPPPVPPALLRRIGVREITGVGKVKVMLRVCQTPYTTNSPESTSSNSFFNLDKRKKQVALYDPSSLNGSTAPEDRRIGVAAPKLFAFDAIFSQDDSQTEVCSSALTDVIHAVINGTDGCLFCFGHAGLGKSYTMLGSPENANTLGIIPCAITWLFRGINEQKQKTGARFSVRVSAVEVCGPSNQLKDLLAGHANDSEQSPGVYLRDDPVFGTQLQNHSELRVPTAERAAFYLDAALESRTNTKEQRDSHLLYTLHVYQYSVAGKGGVAGGRSRLHLIDLGNSERGKSSGGIPLSGLGNILLAIFNGQKHLPYKEHKLTHVMKECLSSLTCHAAMIAHVSPYAQNYVDTLTTVQLASRIHRMRRRKIKFIPANTGSGGSSGEDARAGATSSEPDPSSSDLSADTVIYVGPADDATDGEHPPVYIPSLNSGDNRCVMSKALRGSTAERKSSPKVVQKSPSVSAKSSPVRKPTKVNPSDEQWIDGPKISKHKLAEARHLMKESHHVKKRETWIDGPMQINSANLPPSSAGYGYMDSHKKSMIRKWVENQTSQIQKVKGKNVPTVQMTQFKTCDEEEIKDPLVEGSKEVEKSVVRTGLKLSADNATDIVEEEVKEEDDEVVEIPPALPLIQPLSSREVSMESLDVRLKVQSEYGSDDEVLEIIEVEEPLEPVPTVDSCLQVTEEDIALCMSTISSHPLRILSQENLTVVSTFTDSMSVFTDLERYQKHSIYSDDYEDPPAPDLLRNVNDTSRRKFEQLARLHELYTDRLAKAHVTNSFTYKENQQQQRSLSRCDSLTMSEMLYGNVHEAGSIYSEPPYRPDQEKFCENCKVNMLRPATAQNWYQDLSASATHLNETETHLTSRFQRFCPKRDTCIANLRHPDGASNPNLKEEPRVPGNGEEKEPEPLPPPPEVRQSITKVSPEGGYDSGHDSTPRTSKHSPAAISRRAESGYDSVVRDSESSSIDSDISRHVADGGRASLPAPPNRAVGVVAERIRELGYEQLLLKLELARAKARLHVPKALWSYDLHVATSMDWRHPGYLEALEAETVILRKRVLACKSHIMMVTCFDATPPSTTTQKLLEKTPKIF